MKHRGALELIWRAGVEQVGGHRAVREALAGRQKPDGIVAIGKAATPMLEAALAYGGYDTRSLLITKYGHVVCRHKANQARLAEYQSDGTLEIIEAGHPVPDDNSLAAGRALVKFVEGMDNSTHLLVLVSGGASSLAELLPEEFSLGELQAMTDDMLAQGLDIAAMNVRRTEISLIKGGRLLARFKGASMDVLAISDVEGDDIATIGSGIGMVDERRGYVEIIASNKIARTACVDKAQMLGFDVCENSENIYGDVGDVAQNIAKQLKQGSEGVYIFGGEPTVKLPPNPGNGGRNQQLCLLLAQEISSETGVEFLVAGTDGSDGPGSAAGGFGDCGSFMCCEGAGDALARADAGTFLERCGNLFVTGPTGTNTMDLVVAIKSENK